MKSEIGKELISLIQAEEHIDSLEDYYDDFLSGARKMHTLNEDYIDDHSIRYFFVQHLASVEEIEKKDLSNHYLGKYLKTVKRKKIFEILKNKAEFISKIRGITKDRILNILNGKTTSINVYNGYAEHYFLGSRYAVTFEISVDYTTGQIVIEDAFVGEQNNRNPVYSQHYKHSIGKNL